MNEQALIEQQADLYMKVAARMVAIMKKTPTQDEVIAVFNTVHAWQMNVAIDKQQNARYGKQPAREDPDVGEPPQRERKPQSNVECVECGRTLTVGEKKFCDDQDKQYRCYKCSKG